MIEKHAVEVGQTLHLRPHTKLAPRECHLRLAAELVSVDKWPIVLVRVRESGRPAREIRVHYYNLALHPVGSTTKKGDGDGASTEPTAVVTKPAFRPHKPLSAGDWEEPMLF